MSDLPKGWAETNLREIFEIKYGKGLVKENRNAAGTFNVFGSNGVVGKHDAAFTKGETIIIGRKGSVGEVHLSPKECWPIDTTYFIDEFPAGLPSVYWKFYLASLRLGQKDKSSAIPGINRDDIYSVEVPIPPLNEQKRIVEKLERLLGRVEAAQERLDKIPAILKRFRQSVLAAACSGNLTTDWRHRHENSERTDTTLGEISDYVGGFAYKSPSFETTGKNQVLRIGNVRRLLPDLTTSPVFISDKIADATDRFELFPGDIIISMTGTKYKRDYGSACMIPETYKRLFLNQRVSRLRAKQNLSPKFLLFWLQTDDFRNHFFAEETGNVNQGNVGADGIRMAPISLPTFDEQIEIARRVEELFQFADQIEGRYKKARSYTDKLTQSILAKAFRGELVPQDPNDEPASVLLERIKKETTKPNKRSKPK